MTKNPLIPTPIVDKNGKLTTVHKKTSSSADQARAIPPVAIAATTSSPQQKETFLHHFQNAEQHTDLERYYRVIQEHCPTVIPHLNMLMDTASPAIQRSIAANLFPAFYNLRIHIDALDYISDIEDMSEHLHSCSRLKVIATAAWNVGARGEELRLADRTISNAAVSARIQHDKYHASPNADETLKDHAYWRGLSLLVFAADPEWTRNNHVEFAKWAGAHPQYERIAQLVPEFKTMDIPYLTHVLSEERYIAPSLVRGIL